MSFFSDEKRYQFMLDEYRYLALRHDKIGYRKIAACMGYHEAVAFMDAIETNDEKTQIKILDDFFARYPGFITSDLPCLCNEVFPEAEKNSVFEDKTLNEAAFIITTLTEEPKDFCLSFTRDTLKNSVFKDKTLNEAALIITTLTEEELKSLEEKREKKTS